MEQTKNGVLVINGVCRRKYGRLGHLFASEYARKIASPFGATSAWLLTGAGVLMIALVFGHLSIRKPELTAGPQSYARALFSDRKKGMQRASRWCGATGWRAGSATWRSSRALPDI